MQEADPGLAEASAGYGLGWSPTMRQPVEALATIH